MNHLLFWGAVSAVADDIQVVVVHGGAADDLNVVDVFMDDLEIVDDLVTVDHGDGAIRCADEIVFLFFRFHHEHAFIF